MEPLHKGNLDLLKRLIPGGVAFQITATMLFKSTIDASKSIRDFLVNHSFFEFDDLPKGGKEFMDCQLFHDGSLLQSTVSLVRPKAKPERPGDPRIWIYNLKKNVKANDWIYFCSKEDVFYVIPISEGSIFKDQIELLFGKQLNYVVSSGLKNLIGKQLITDEFVAIFELVKNSFDAHARKVDVIFQNISGDEGKIIIRDDGKGMNFEELKNKWLFVGYSAKKDGTEDDDFRHGLGVKRIFAGAKGVGRFSCDRLGRNLKLITRKDELNSTTEVLYTNWANFEENPKARFEDIGVRHETLPSTNSEAIFGTTLEISGLHEKWPREKLLKLKLSLEKLILPELEDGIIPVVDERRREFKINIIAPDERKEDQQRGKSIKDYYKIVNGSVKNLIFESLQLKTATICVSISQDGKLIETKLTDKGKDVYEITESNRYDLKHIKVVLYHLNQSAKLTFSRRMGFPIMKYGHVFLFKGGFRVYPFGEYEEDTFAVDLRKSDKEFSRIGTRSLSGRIEINGDLRNEEFIESTSRDAGLIRNKAYFELRRFYHDILSRFEKYVVDVVKWGRNIDFEDLEQGERKEEVLNLISDLTGSDSIKEIWYNPKIVNILSSKQESSAQKLLQNLQKAAEKTGDRSLVGDIALAQERLLELEAITKQAEQIAADANISVLEARQALEFEQQKNKYLLAADKNISDDILSMLHNYKNITHKIHTNIELLTRKVISDDLSKDELLARLGAIGYNVDKAYKMSRLMTKADFRTKQEKVTVEISDYIKEYINDFNSIFEDRKLKFEFNRKGAPFFRKVSLLDLSIIIDNLISNSEKKGANKIRIDFNTLSNAQMEMVFSDDGVGLSKALLKNPKVIFELGITDTDGSGIGLHTVVSLLKENYASIDFLGNGIVLKGAAFQLIFN